MNETHKTVNYDWNPADYAARAGFIPALGEPLIALLRPSPGERILDLGCGDGALTLKIAQSGATVVGVDSSPEFVAAARAKGIDARRMKAEALDFEEEFDAVLSNAALHWMLDAEAVLRGVRRALRPGGRFAGEFGGKGNVAPITDALQAELRERGISTPPFPWFFPSGEEYRALLEREGFVVERTELFERPTPMGESPRAWIEIFGRHFVTAVPEAHREDYLESVAQRLQPVLRRDGRDVLIPYVRQRFVARKP